MARSLGLTLYSLGANRSAEPPPDWPERPSGPLIWFHAPVPDGVRALAELARRMREEQGITILMTAPVPVAPQPGLIEVAVPPDTTAANRAFLDHWTPDLVVISDGEVRPFLVHEAARRAIRMILVDARMPYLPRNRSGLWPGLMRTCLGQFTRIHAISDEAGRSFRRRGAPEGTLRIEGRMEEGSAALSCTEAERAALVRRFQTRPVWLAAGLSEVEDAAVIAAHRAALRLAHRLLLIVVPDNPDRGEGLARHLTETENWTVALRSADDEPDEETEVFLADAPSEMGLWYRLAPITFLGGTLYGAGSTRDPFEAAALGSAILHGPRYGAWGSVFSRLVEAHATRLVMTPGDLAEGLSDLLAPDRAARLAQSAWAVSSSGADVTDRMVMLLCQMMGARA